MPELPDALLMARMQFAFAVGFHFAFPAITIGPGSYLAVLEGLWLKTGNDAYLELFRYGIKIFAIVFAMGVVSGIVMSYHFGTNCAVFSDKAGSIIGPLMACEVLTAFFLEAGFLGIMLFGMARAGKGLHFTATLMMAAGTFISAFWILSHTVSAAYLTTAFLVGGVGAWHLLRDRDNPRSRIMFSMAMRMGPCLSPAAVAAVAPDRLQEAVISAF